MKYFELNDDINYPNRWYLGDILEVDNWEISTSKPVGVSNLQIEIVRDGNEMDFTFTEAYGVPIVSKKVKDALDSLPEITFVPVQILNRDCNTEYFVLIISAAIDCVDDDSSEFQKFEENDPVRPDKAGEYRAFIKLRLNVKKIVDIDVFRLRKFEIAVIVSEQVKNSLEAIGTTGMDLSTVV
jgi:hypothetical protein